MSRNFPDTYTRECLYAEAEELAYRRIKEPSTLTEGELELLRAGVDAALESLQARVSEIEAEVERLRSVIGELASGWVADRPTDTRTPDPPAPFDLDTACKGALEAEARRRGWWEDEEDEWHKPWPNKPEGTLVALPYLAWPGDDPDDGVVECASPAEALRTALRMDDKQRAAGVGNG